MQKRKPQQSAHEIRKSEAHLRIRKHCHPHCIAAGNPAHVVKKRFTDEQIARLLDKAWWNMSDEQIQSIIPQLCSENIDDFLS